MKIFPFKFFVVIDAAIPFLPTYLIDWLYDKLVWLFVFRAYRLVQGVILLVFVELVKLTPVEIKFLSCVPSFNRCEGANSRIVINGFFNPIFKVEIR